VGELIGKWLQCSWKHEQCASAITLATLRSLSVPLIEALAGGRHSRPPASQHPKGALGILTTLESLANTSVLGGIDVALEALDHPARHCFLVAQRILKPGLDGGEPEVSSDATTSGIGGALVIAAPTWLVGTSRSGSSQA